MKPNNPYVDLLNEAAQLALLGLSQYQKMRAAAAANGVPPEVIAAADARFANIELDPLAKPAAGTEGPQA